MHARMLRILLISMIGMLLLSCSTIKQVKDDIHWLKLNQMAMDAYMTQEYSKAANLFEQALSKNQDNYNVAYNLACCHALLGDAENAAKYLTTAFANGYRNVDYMKADPDFDPVREESAFRSAVKKIEKRIEALGDQKYVTARTMQTFRIRLPKDYDPDQYYPLVVGLHGNGGNSDGFIAQYEKIENPRVIYVAPEGQYPLNNNVGPQFKMRSWALRAGNPDLERRADGLVEAYIMSTIENVSIMHNISQVYLMGFSQGAVYSYTIGMRNPDEIEGVIAFGGYLMNAGQGKDFLTNEHIESAKDLRIFIAHGVDDGAVAVDEARELTKKLKEKGYDVKLQEFEGRHEIPAEVLNLAANWIES